MSCVVSPLSLDHNHPIEIRNFEVCMNIFGSVLLERWHPSVERSLQFFGHGDAVAIAVSRRDDLEAEWQALGVQSQWNLRRQTHHKLNVEVEWRLTYLCGRNVQHVDERPVAEIGEVGQQCVVHRCRSCHAVIDQDAIVAENAL